MKTYKYVAVNELGDTTKDTVQANNLNELEKILDSRGLTIISYKEKTGSSFNLFKKRVAIGKISVKDKISLLVQLGQLERAGVSILETMGEIASTTKNKAIRLLIQDVYNSIDSGQSLSQALAKHPRNFDNLFISLIVAGEKNW